MKWNVAFWKLCEHDIIHSPAKTGNLYCRWVTSPKRLRLNCFPGLAFTSKEIDAAATWSAMQKSCGLRANIADGTPGGTNVLEVFGPDDEVPHCIMYPSHAGIQVDEFTGDSNIYPCLEMALQEIAPLH